MKNLQLQMEAKIKQISIYRKNVTTDQDTGQQTEGEPVLMSATKVHEKWRKPESEIQYNQQGELEQQTNYTYNEKGFLIREVLLDGDGEVLEERSFEPDDNDRVSIERRHYADGSFDTLTFTYDQNGQLIRKVLTDDEGSIESIEMFDYADGLLIKEEVRNEDDEVVRQVEYTYDAEGLLDEKVLHDHETGQYVRQEYAYSDKGFREAILSYDEDDNLVERVLLDLDEKGRPVGVEEEDRKKKNKTTMAYDDSGHILFQEETDINGELVSRVRRHYDEQGLLTSTEVEVRNPLRAINQHYRVYHAYDFY